MNLAIYFAYIDLCTQKTNFAQTKFKFPSTTLIKGNHSEPKIYLHSLTHHTAAAAAGSLPPFAAVNNQSTTYHHHHYISLRLSKRPRQEVVSRPTHAHGNQEERGKKRLLTADQKINHKPPRKKKSVECGCREHLACMSQPPTAEQQLAKLLICI
jgi:hypothetical protein